MFAVYPIVEGQGEVQAVPVLLRRIASEICQRHDIEVLHPHRVPRGRMLARSSPDLERAVELGARKVAQSAGGGAIIVLLDADDDCPAEIGQQLLARIERADVQTSVVLAKREYEAWLLAGARSLTRHRSVSDAAVAPADPEGVRGAKAYLKRNVLARDAHYRETIDQPALTAVLDLAEARAAPSFDKLCRDLCSLLAA